MNISLTNARNISFHHEISTNLKKEVTWDEFDRALKDSGSSVLWPTHSQVEGISLIDSSIIDVTYSIGLFNPTYQYLVEVDKKNWQFSYEAFGDEHPFTGGATITLEDGLDGKTTLLIWDGEYDTQSAGFFTRRAFLSFEKNSLIP